MRDINRIDYLLGRIAAIWKTNPDLRFMQLLHFIQANSNVDIDTFYLEDEDLCQELDRIFQKVLDNPEQCGEKCDICVYHSLKKHEDTYPCSHCTSNTDRTEVKDYFTRCEWIDREKLVKD